MNLDVRTYPWKRFSISKLYGDQITIEVDDDIMAFIKKSKLLGKNVIDGGSNIGVMSLVLSDVVGKKGLVYAFELQPVIYRIAISNHNQNKAANIIQYNKALSNKSGEQVGFTHIDYSAEILSSVGIKTEPSLSGQEHCGMVETIAIDDLNIENVGLIKLDLEGYEPKALDGMWGTIDKWKPNMIIEISPGYLGNGANDLIETIKAHGYSLVGNESYNYFCEPN
jgi:FkbM family methyltransferase